MHAMGIEGSHQAEPGEIDHERWARDQARWAKEEKERKDLEDNIKAARKRWGSNPDAEHERQ